MNKIFWIVKSRDGNGICHTTLFFNKSDAELFLKIITEKRPGYESSIEEDRLPAIHEKLSSACLTWGF